MWRSRQPSPTRCHPEGVQKGAATSHRLGFAVKVLGDGGLPSHDTRRWSSGPHLRHSLERLRAILDHLERHDIRMYRLPTALAPYASHPELTQFHGQVEQCAEELAEGGATGGVEAATDRFLDGFERLSERAQARLVIENDDRSFGLVDVLSLAERSGLHVVWDVLHHRCHDPARMSNRDALAAALATWEVSTTPKIHYSSPRLDVEERRVRAGRRIERRLVLPQLRAHADLIDPIGFEQFLLDTPAGRDFDVMLEAKAKDVALLRLRSQLAERGFAAENGRLRVAGMPR